MTDWDQIENEIAAQNARMSDSVPEGTATKRLADAEALAKREGWSNIDYVNGYCSECDEEYNVPETANKAEECPICGCQLETD